MLSERERTAIEQMPRQWRVDLVRTFLDVAPVERVERRRDWRVGLLLALSVLIAIAGAGWAFAFGRWDATAVVALNVAIGSLGAIMLQRALYWSYTRRRVFAKLIEGVEYVIELDGDDIIVRPARRRQKPG